MNIDFATSWEFNFSTGLTNPILNLKRDVPFAFNNQLAITGTEARQASFVNFAQNERKGPSDAVREAWVNLRYLIAK